MPTEDRKSQRWLELFLVVIVLALTVLLREMAGYKMIVLNLFFLPVVLAGFFLGRYRGGVLALLCVISASVVTVVDVQGFASFSSPMVVGLSVVMWGAVLGLTSLLVGTLSDERNTKIVELHEAYVGVVEVLSRYLQSANPALEARSSRVARLCQEVAKSLRLSPRQIDDIRVAALLHDMGNVEITSRVIRKAVGSLEEPESTGSHTFCGADLVHSLASVLTGAMPLLLDQDDSLDDDLASSEEGGGTPRELGASIIRTVRAFVALQDGEWGQGGAAPEAALAQLRDEPPGEHDPLVLAALARAVAASESSSAPVPALV